MTETLRGCVMRQLYNGIPHRVFVQHAGHAFRAVCEVRLEAERYVPAGPIMDWREDAQSDDPAEIAANYLREVHR